ncbi:hypothetical protein [Nocardiopsis salina]|uniref:hypothetical protein n=1 Tax=Nocardiopsis salina TaxID=245836 RepID=UPI000345ED37|nr:hypothetical protein [Nocardiopsis salina]
MDAARAEKLVRRRTRRLFGLLPGVDPCRADGRTLYWPVDLAAATAVVKPPLRKERQVRIPVARDAVTGRLGTVDMRLADPAEVDPGEEALLLEPDHLDGREWWEFARNQVVLRYRPSRITGLALVERRRVHVPYRVVRCGPDTWLVDSMFGRAVDARSLGVEHQRTLGL